MGRRWHPNFSYVEQSVMEVRMAMECLLKFSTDRRAQSMSSTMVLKATNCVVMAPPWQHGCSPNEVWQHTGLTKQRKGKHPQRLELFQGDMQQYVFFLSQLDTLM